MHQLLLYAVRPGLFAEGRFMGRVLDGWLNDIEDFMRTKLPHLVMVAIIAVVLSRLLQMITGRMIHIAELHATGQSRLSQVKTLAGVVRTTGLAIIFAIVSL